MTSPKIRVILDILEEHFEEIQFLWGIRQNVIRSPDDNQRTLHALEERIESHTQGLLGLGEIVIPMVSAALTAEDPMAVFAAAYVLLRMNTEASIKYVLDVLSNSEAEKLEGVRQAICHGPIDRIVGPLRDIFESAPPGVAVVAAEALAFHSQLDPKGKRMAGFLADENPLVRKAAWRVVSLIDSPRAN